MRLWYGGGEHAADRVNLSSSSIARLKMNWRIRRSLDEGNDELDSCSGGVLDRLKMMNKHIFNVGDDSVYQIIRMGDSVTT